ncbi:EAL domain-containing protein [uncultured Desulfobacter sp.]|uniref:EAL domain-containing protein n=1 Tax=uncultured Desulfobacter sp. TaxID=240139 RepID=UPI0029F4EA9C|nr:EAL domain-containing protein [uncultured Desulfobacter sp.]
MNDCVKEKILIVDDTPANIDVLGGILSRDYDICVAISGHMALDIVNSGEIPDLILLDIMMPEMDGYEVARLLKANQNTNHIPIIFVTAKVEDEDEAAGFEMGAVDYIRKPVNAPITLARIKSQLELKRYRDQLSWMVKEKSHKVKHSQQALVKEKKKRIQVQGDLKNTSEQAHKNQAYFRELFMNSPYGIVLIGRDKKILNSNKSFSDLFGYAHSDIVLNDFPTSSPQERTREKIKDLVQKALAGRTGKTETECRHKKGYTIQVSALAYPIKIDDVVQAVFIFFEDITQRKLFEQKLHHQAFHDVLTGIANRRYFTEQLDTFLSMQKKNLSFRFAVLLIDLDRFKNVNDSLGHQAGDQLLKMVAEKIKVCLRNNDLFARLGGDEFAILLSDADSDDQISTIAERITKAAASPFIINGQEVRISASIGVVNQTLKYDKADSLIRDADLAMYHAKDSGKAQFQFFSSRMHESALMCLTIETELRKALERDELVLYFQPIINIKSKVLEGFEALIRWRHPHRGMVQPGQFISIAEETGLILPIGDWVIQEGCRRLIELKQKTSQPLTMNLNVSIKQFLQNDFTVKLKREISKAGLSPQDIKLEFTESLLMEHTQQALKKLYVLRDLGVKLAIDDFGTGYSSLSYLQKFPIDQIKIDRSFINAMEKQKESCEIVKSILALANSLNLSTVAEGVETQLQLEQLLNFSCGSAQGYFIAKPMPWESLQRLYSKSRSFLAK